MKSYPLAFFLLLSITLSAQNRIYLDKYMRTVDSTDRYEFYQDERQLQDGQVYLKLFKKSGAPVSQGAYSRSDQTGELLEEGVHRYFYDNKKPWYQVEFKKGKREGMLASWYPSGASKRIEYFKNGVSTGGECFGEDGKPIAFTPFWQAPQYKKGQEALDKFLHDNLKYPQTAYDYGLEADITVKVDVAENGKVLRIQTFDSNVSIFFKEALRLVTALEGWKPGQIDDVPKAFFTTINVKFNLADHQKNTPPGTKRFDLIKDFIDSGTRFYINEERKLVSSSEPYVYQGEAKSLADGNLLITHYDQDGAETKTGVFACYARLLEVKLPKDSVNLPAQTNSMASGEPIWQFEQDADRMLLQGIGPDQNAGQSTAIPPAFVGGDPAIFRYLQERLNYPEEAKENEIQGVVVVEFVINKTGDVTNVMLVQDLGGGCGKEALRVIKLMPRWIPGQVDGRPVKVRYTLPIRFVLE